MGKIINACGLTCPAPVLLVKDSVEQNNDKEMTVLVDNGSSMENVTRFLKSRGYTVTDSQEGGIFRLEARCHQRVGNDSQPETKKVSRDTATQKNLVLVTSDCLGSGDDVLGGKLMVSYLKTIKEMGTDLWQLIFVNGGVKLTIGSSPVLQELQEYEKSGVIIFACGTCLEHFGLTAHKKVGGTTNMLDIVMATQLADKVITIS
ncbi:sulfurtransferase-like selenium metabolism protein YedF [Desulfopila sp. IMCC35006]|uniref:sulfurtransferase-like selenium metabolism protein YedF n=1 Tax=Desulfopila sp. IMCC35006 TaxID=2569542 RepID=UPI0010ABD077|nr:sulfurtransferase-like selenium metabolism protein YedF [Desulfopila sp. IMCC35006]TKB25206.1 sulfurtransferase-like selenium metabolism protein YedF [Desulfopila sp. IMCC35006]